MTGGFAVSSARPFLAKRTSVHSPTCNSLATQQADCRTDSRTRAFVTGNNFKEFAHRFDAQSAGLQYGVTLTQSIIVAVDYIGTTSEPEAKIHAYKIKADEPEYITLSVGYKFSF